MVSVQPAVNGEGLKEFDPFEQEELPPTVGSRRAPALPVAEQGDGREPVEKPGGVAANADGAPVGLDHIQARWNVVVEELKRGRAVVSAALLAEAEPLRCEGATLVIGFRQSILRDKWERGDNKQRLIAALKAVFGQPIATRSEVMGDDSTGGGSPGAPVRPTAPAKAVASPADTPTRGDAGEATRSAAKQGSNGTDALEGEALLHEVIAAFEGQIVEESPPLN
jgi:hypothetical protein